MAYVNILIAPGILLCGSRHAGLTIHASPANIQEDSNIFFLWQRN